MIALGSDHVGIELKREMMKHLDEKKIPYIDYGPYDTERTNYTIYAVKVAQSILSGECDRGMLFCGTGVGISLAANKIHGIRAVVCSDCYSAKLSKEHNNTNILAMGSRVVGVDLAKLIADLWLEAEFEGGRHQIRIDQIREIEEDTFKI